VRAFFRWATRQNLLLANPAADLRLPKRPSRLPRYTLSVSEVEKVLEGCDVTTLLGVRDRAVLEVLWATGLRRAEVINLCLWDVQWEKGTVFVRQGKGHKDRVVPISARALSWVRRYVDEVRPRYALPADEGRLFLSDSGLPFLPARLTRAVRQRILNAGVEAKGAACHLFRHACATQMLEGGAEIRFVQELLGHADINTTQIYTRVSIAKLKAVYEATHPGARPAGSEPGPTEQSQPPTAGELLEELEHEAASEADAGDGE
jgi:integrase/recombinase XerD